LANIHKQMEPRHVKCADQFLPVIVYNGLDKFKVVTYSTDHFIEFQEPKNDQGHLNQISNIKVEQNGQTYVYTAYYRSMRKRKHYVINMGLWTSFIQSIKASSSFITVVKYQKDGKTPAFISEDDKIMVALFGKKDQKTEEPYDVWD
jgi:hypothetical protein